MGLAEPTLAAAIAAIWQALKKGSCAAGSCPGRCDIANHRHWRIQDSLNQPAGRLDIAPRGVDFQNEQMAGCCLGVFKVLNHLIHAAIIHFALEAADHDAVCIRPKRDQHSDHKEKKKSETVGRSWPSQKNVLVGYLSTFKPIPIQNSTKWQELACNDKKCANLNERLKHHPMKKRCRHGSKSAQ